MKDLTDLSVEIVFGQRNALTKIWVFRSASKAFQASRFQAFCALFSLSFGTRRTVPLEPFQQNERFAHCEVHQEAGL